MISAGHGRHSSFRSSRKRFITVIVLLLVAALITLFVFNRNGVLTIGILRAERDSISERIDRLEGGVDSLRRDIEMLLCDSFYMEKMVREILGWGRPGELLLRLMESE